MNEPRPFHDLTETGDWVHRPHAASYLAGRSEYDDAQCAPEPNRSETLEELKGCLLAPLLPILKIVAVAVAVVGSIVFAADEAYKPRPTKERDVQTGHVVMVEPEGYKP